MFSNYNSTKKIKHLRGFHCTDNKTNNTKVTKSNYSEHLPARIHVSPFFFQYFAENHNSSLKFSETESSVYLGSPVLVLEDFTSV